MQFSIEDLEKLEKEFLEKLIQKQIEQDISKGQYPPKEEWSAGSDKMIASFKSCAISHQFSLAKKLLKELEDVINESNVLSL